jgi:hypothetical protein
MKVNKVYQISRIMNKSDKFVNITSVFCGFIFLIATIGGCFLATAKFYKCGIIFTNNKIITTNIDAIVINSTIYNYSYDSIVKYKFNNNLFLDKINNHCFMTIYEGSNYNFGESQLLKNNDTVNVFFEKNKGECFNEQITISCYTNYILSIIGFLLLMFVGLFVLIYLIFLICICNTGCITNLANFDTSQERQMSFSV